MECLPSPFSQRPDSQGRLGRLGLHYFQDTLHYRQKDLDTWLPRLKNLGVSWLVLKASPARAIPEHFILGLQEAGIEPILQFDLPVHHFPDLAELSPILAAYGQWGIRGIIWFDRPNLRSAWLPSSWAQSNLVERYLDRLVPLWQLSSQYGLISIFPPLEPGGDYWDTAFLRAAFESLSRRKLSEHLEHLVLSAYAWTGGHPLNWGNGGQDRWPEAYPYHADSDQQDQRGFRIYDWYNTICESILGKKAPIFLLGLGLTGDPTKQDSFLEPKDRYAELVLAIAKLLANEEAFEPEHPETPLEPLTSDVIAGCFWAFSSNPEQSIDTFAWFQEDGENSTLASRIMAWINQPRAAKKPGPLVDSPLRKDFYEPKSIPAGHHLIQHYLLLPTYQWGTADWHLNVIRPFVNKYHPTVGYSIQEAALASRVTVIGDEQAFPEEMLNYLRQSGSIVERISGDGTKIATMLAER